MSYAADFALFALCLLASSAHAGFVQQNSALITTSGNTIPVVFIGNVVKGDLILACMSSNNASAPTLSMSDSPTGNSYTQINSTVSWNGAASFDACFFAIASANAFLTVTGNSSTTSTRRFIGITDYNGVRSVNPLDSSNSNSGTTVGTGAGNVSVTIPAHAATDQVLGWASVINGIITASSGFNQRINANGHIEEDATLGSTTIVTVNDNTNADPFVIFGMAFKVPLTCTIILLGAGPC